MMGTNVHNPRSKSSLPVGAILGLEMTICVLLERTEIGKGTGK